VSNKERLHTLKPAVDKRVLLFLAGFMWIAVGAMLLTLASSWLAQSHDNRWHLFGGAGLVCALLIHHFGFLRIVDKNLDRILLIQSKNCVFSFMTWKSYLIVAVMISMGILLRHSSIPKLYLATLYTAIGLALILSSIRYMRVLLSQCKKSPERNNR